MYYLLVGLLSSWLVSTLATCPQIGSYQSSSFEYSRIDGLFLSVDSPSQCYGRVSQWNFCYQRNNIANDTYGVKFMIYRQNDTTPVYYRVPGSITIVLQTIVSPSASCVSQSLTENEQFNIQPNDIVAVCMINNGPIEPLQVTSSSRNEALYITSVSDDCVESDLMLLDLSRVSSQLRNLVLVETVLEFKVGNSPKGSSPSITPGLCININFPSEIDGYITSWKYCYYTNGVNSLRNYTAVFNVWHRTSDNVTLSVVPNSATFITLQPQFTIAAIFCKEVELEPERYFYIMRGDYVGVVLPTNNPIPLIGATSDYNILVNYNTSKINTLLQNSFILQQQALHLYASIRETSDGISQSSVSSTSEEVTSPVSETRNNPSQSSVSSINNNVERPTGKISGGVIAAAVIIIIVVVVTIIVVVTVLITYFVNKYKIRTQQITLSDRYTIPPSYEQDLVINRNVAYWTRRQTSNQNYEQQDIPTTFNAAYIRHVDLTEREIIQEEGNVDYDYI